MEERTKKFSLENFYEDAHTLKVKQNKLIMKKKEIGKKFEINRILTTDNVKRMTHWDIILLQVKYSALDMFEERKWKKGVYHLMSSGAQNKFKKTARKKKLDELYKRCMCLFLSMNLNNNLADISQGHEKINISEKLNSYIRNVTNLEYFNVQFSHWKDSLRSIRSQVQKKFGDSNVSKSKPFLQVLDLMENMINVQEENVKKVRSQDSDDIMMRCEDKFEDLSENFNLNLIEKEINYAIDQIVNEIKFQDDDIFLQESGNNFKTSNKGESPSKMTEFNSNVNPRQLFYDTNSSSKYSEELKMYFEKTLKIENEKIEILPIYNFNKIVNSEIDINKDIDEYTKIYLKLFPSICFTDHYREGEVDLFRRSERLNKEFENRIFILKFSNFTTLQKLVLLWGVTNFGLNLQILAELPNIFTFSKSISYDSEEINLQLEKFLFSLNVDLLSSNFEGLMRPKTNSRLIYNIDSPMLNSNQCDFFYNQKIMNFINNQNEKFNIFDLDKINQSSKSEHVVQTNQNISLISESPFIKTYEKKLSMKQNLQDDIKKICLRVEKNFESNYTKNACIDYQNMTKMKKENLKLPIRKLSVPSSYVNSGLNITNGSHINTKEIENNLNNFNFDPSALKFSELALDSTKPTTRQETLEGVSFYSSHSIQKEWEILRTPWFQNNIQFKPKFRKPYKPPQMNGSQINTSQGVNNLNILRNLNDNRSN